MMDMSQNAVNEDTTALTRNLDMLERKLFTAGNGADKAFNAWRRRRYVLPPPRTVRVASGHSVPPTWCCCDSGLPRGWGYRLCGRAAVERGIAWTLRVLWYVCKRACVAVDERGTWLSGPVPRSRRLFHGVVPVGWLLWCRHDLITTAVSVDAATRKRKRAA